MKKRSNNWIDSDFDDGFDEVLENFEFTKPLPPPPKRRSSSSGTKNVAKPFKNSNNNDQKPWSAKYYPQNSAQLAVNSKKVAEVKSWLQSNLHRKNPGILILHGPPGSGKTATLKILATELNCSIQEWTSPNENVDYSDNPSELPFVSQTKSFKNFMIRANKYLSLESFSKGSKIILLEDLPNFALKSPQDFQDILRIDSRIFPLVIIQSQEEIKDIFPQEFLEELRIDCINFNPVTTTNLVKLLTQIAQTEKVPVPDKTTLTSLAASSNGDVRSAINSFQIGCATKEYRKRIFESSSSIKKNSKNSSTTKNLAVIGAKDSNLDLFHAIGKVLYCKRTDESEKCKFVDKTKLRKKLMTDPEELMENIPTSEDNFTAFLHQSYGDFFTDIKDLSQAVENLSFSDNFFNEWTHTGKVSLSYYGGLISIRGLCYHNKDRSRNFSGMKTFHKPEWYSVMKLSRSRQGILQNYFKNQQRGCEVSQLLAPLYAEIFLPASGDFDSSIIEACKFKDMPRKKICLKRTQSDFPIDYDDIKIETEDVDFLIEDDEED